MLLLSRFRLFVLIFTLVLPIVCSAQKPPPPPPRRKFKSVTVRGLYEDPKQRGSSREQHIVYFVERGYAITQGDINIGLEKDLLKKKVRRSGDKRSISIFPSWEDRKWPDATMVWKFNDTEAESVMGPTVEQAIVQWTKASPFLKFKKLPTSSEPTNGVVTIVMTRGQPACWAPIGYGNWAMQISLDVACNVANTVHEFGHAWGLHHEHQRPDRDDHVLFNCSALSDYPTYGQPGTSCPGNPNQCCEDSSCWGWACAFTHITDLYWKSTEPYDFKSVMHYREDAFAAWPAKSLVGKDGVVPVWDSDTPSVGDRDRICEIYSAQCGGTGGPICGNGIKEGSEECDDGNNIDGDGCSSKCTIEHLPPGICEVCVPHPLQNKCDITTSCIAVPPPSSPSKHFCACRAGYKANPGYTGEVEWRLPFIGQEYRVFVKPGVICDTLCNNPNAPPNSLCNEVPVKLDCGR